MGSTEQRTGLVPALLKQWRSRRGLSQLDLALAADVSARHISFLETGRSLPSPEMVLLLGSTLGVPLSQVNAMLVAAGHDPAFDESDDAVPEQIAQAIELLKAHHEPFPLVVVDGAYDVVDVNQGAATVISAVLGLPPGPPPTAELVADLGLNLARLTFDPAGAQPYLANFDEVGRQVLWRIQREVLADPGNRELGALLDELLDMPTVSQQWREADLSVPSEPALVLHLSRDDLELRFLTTVTAFQAPQNVEVERLRIEHWFPYDDATATACRQLGAH
ncbi:MAG: helix-turn-helix transcriptional regulator [Actinobacteria bacterium]|nr:helix-turn-helix transcriptional regulator [Actinomycetota bacterium]